MKIALLGAGNVGKPTFEIIYYKKTRVFIENDIEIKYILIKSLLNKPFDCNLFVDNFDVIENDGEVSTVIEMMGASVSYDYIKRCLSKGKNVITANKEVIAMHFSELQEIAKSKNVKLFFEAAVGGSIPIINALMNNNKVNNIYRIEGVLNGTTNFILTKMHKEKIEFNQALKLAQKNGFAEANPTADLEGLDMVRKIAILSQIAYRTEIDLSQVYSYGITSLSKDVIDLVDALGYTLKFMAYSEKKNDSINICVEPVILRSNDLVSNTDYEYNIIRYYGDNSSIQMMYGKGAGPMTANAIVNDLGLLLGGYDSYISTINRYKIVGNSNINASYLLQIEGDIDESIIDNKLNGFIITKKISSDILLSLLPKIKFYAKFLE